MGSIGFINDILDYFSVFWRWLGEILQRIFNDFTGWIYDRINDVRSYVDSSFVSLSKWMSELPSSLSSLINSMMNSFLQTVLSSFSNLVSYVNSSISNFSKMINDRILVTLDNLTYNVGVIKGYLQNIWTVIQPYVISTLENYKKGIDQRLGDIDRSIYVMRTDFEQWKRDFIGNLNSFVFSIFEGWVKEFTTGFEKGLEEK